MTIHTWRQPQSNMVQSQKVMRNAILDDSKMRAALTQYFKSINLQDKINKGLTEGEVLGLFDKAIRDFTRKMHNQITARINPPPIDQTDLTNPDNMTVALSTPGSFANIQMSEVSDALIADLNLQTANNLQAQQNEDKSQQQPNPSGDTEKVAAIITAAKTLEDTDSASGIAEAKIKQAFEKCTGHKAQYEHPEETAENKINAPKLQPQKDTGQRREDN